MILVLLSGFGTIIWFFIKKWFSKETKDNKESSIKAGGNILAGGDIVAGNNNVVNNPKIESKNLETFEKLVENEDWHFEMIDEKEVWVCKVNNTYQIQKEEGEEGYQAEPWTQVYPSNITSGSKVSLKINETVIKQIQFVSCDHGNIFVPLTTIRKGRNGRIDEWDRRSLEYKIAKIIGKFYIYDTIEGVAEKSKIKII